MSSANTHVYALSLQWTGNLGTGTRSYSSYSRDCEVKIKGKPRLHLSADPKFRGDPGKFNPEELLLASLSSCHMLWFLHLCADHNLVVETYSDSPEGKMITGSDGSGAFKQVVLKPYVGFKTPPEENLFQDLHRQANKMCFIANSVNFPILHTPRIAK